VLPADVRIARPRDRRRVQLARHLVRPPPGADPVAARIDRVGARFRSCERDVQALISAPAGGDWASALAPDCFRGTEPRTRSPVGHRLIPSEEGPEAPDGELLADGHLPADRDREQILDGIVEEIRLCRSARTPGSRCRHKGGVPAGSRPHGSPPTGQTPHLPEHPPAQPGAERADIIASEPV
jgi:hypothetical protein